MVLKIVSLNWRILFRNSMMLIVVRNITMISNTPKHQGPQMESNASNCPSAPKVKLLKCATTVSATVHSPMVEINPTNEKMRTSAK